MIFRQIFSSNPQRRSPELTYQVLENVLRVGTGGR